MSSHPVGKMLDGSCSTHYMEGIYVEHKKFLRRKKRVLIALRCTECGTYRRIR